MIVSVALPHFFHKTGMLIFLLLRLNLTFCFSRINDSPEGFVFNIKKPNPEERKYCTFLNPLLPNVPVETRQLIYTSKLCERVED